MSIFQLKILKYRKQRIGSFQNQPFYFLIIVRSLCAMCTYRKKSRREKESTKVIVFSCFHRYLFHLFQGSPGRRGLPGNKGPNGKRVRDEISQ